MSSQPLIPPLRDLPAGRLAVRAGHLRTELRSTRQRLPRARILALAAFVLALLAVLLATPAVGLRDRLAHLFSADEPPPEVITRYFGNQNVGPDSLNPAVIPGEARVATAVFVPGFGKRVVWVAPTRHGGFCSTDLCDSRRKHPLAVTLRVTGPTSKEPPQTNSDDVHVLFEGDTLIHRAEGMVVHFEDGSTERVRLRWVPKPIDAGFFIYELPKEDWDVGKRPVFFTVEDARGNELARDRKGAGYLRETQRYGLALPSNPPAPPPPPPLVSKSRTFDDATGDAPASPDIKSLTVTERHDGFMDFLVTLGGDFEWSEDEVLIALDVDQNPDTGSAFYGTELELVLQSEPAGAEVMPALYRAHGWDFRRQRHARAGWTLGPHEGGFSIKRSSLGLTKYQGFNIVVGSVGNHADTAPDFGTFNYQRLPGRQPPSLPPDRRPPKVLAYDSTGVSGEAKLQYWVLEGRGRTRQVIRIYRGSRLLQTVWTPLADVNAFRFSETTWEAPPSVHGALRYCVRSFDAAGNRSSRECANLEVR